MSAVGTVSSINLRVSEVLLGSFNECALGPANRYTHSHKYTLLHSQKFLSCFVSFFLCLGTGAQTQEKHSTTVLKDLFTLVMSPVVG